MSSQQRSPVPSPSRVDPFLGHYAARARGMVASEIRALFAVAARPEVVSLAGGMPYISALPLDAVGEMAGQLVADRGAVALQYGSGQGDPGLRQGICDVMSLEGIRAHPDEVVVTVGSQQALDLLTRIFVDPGDVVLAEGPSYVGALGTFASYEADVIHVPMDDHGLVPGALSDTLGRLAAAGRRPKFLYTCPSFHNPAGVTLPAPRRAAILDICQRAGLPVIEDNPYGLLGFDGEPARALRADDEHVIYLGTFSKTIAPGLRVGWAVAPAGVRDKLVLAAESAVLCHSSLAQLLVREYLDSQPWREQVKVFRELYRERRDTMLDALRASMPAVLPVDRAGRRLLRVAGAARDRRQGDAAPGHRGPGGLRARYRLLLGRFRGGPSAAVLLLPRARPDPGRRAAAGRRDQHRTGPAIDVPAHPMSDLGHVLVLAGGMSAERAVSLRSGDRVLDALRDIGVDADLADADAALIPAITTDPPVAVFPAIHGACGEDGSIREVLALLSVPYVGSTAAASRSAFDKPTAKAAAAAAGLRTPPSVTLPRETFHDLGAGAILERVVARLGLPLFVKPARGGSALGATLVLAADELPSAMMTCFGYGDTALVEQFIAGTEVAVGVLDLGDGPNALPPVEIHPLSGSYDYAARYTAGQTEFHAPARLPADLMARAEQAAVTAHRALGLRDLSRTDLIVSGPDVFFLEVNVAPGMTETSTLPMALTAAGLDLGVSCRELLRLAAARGN